MVTKRMKTAYAKRLKNRNIVLEPIHNKLMEAINVLYAKQVTQVLNVIAAQAVIQIPEVLILLISNV